MTAPITFPTNPELGQEYIPDNAAVYVWVGNRWSTAWPVVHGQAYSVAEGGFSDTVYDELTDNTIDGGSSGNGLTLKYKWLRDLPDSRDYQYISVAGAIPTSVDLRQYCSAIEDQGYLGSCTGNAIAGAIELLDRKKNNKALEISRLFIYYQERLIEGTVRIDAGAYIRDGLKAVNKYGAPLETLWPYNINQFTVQPSTAAYIDAAKRKVTAYQRCADFAAVKNALAQGQPVVVGFDVYESFETGAWQQANGSGLMPYPNTRTEQYLGGHAVCLVGYNDATQRFIARNSWGTSWADNGYFYMPYQVIKNTSMSSDFWTISSVTNP